MGLRVFKFGGASVKDAAAVKNLVSVLEITKEPQLVIVISAMGKITNALEKVVHAYFQADHNILEPLNEVIDFHNTLAFELFQHREHRIFKKIKNLFEELNGFLQRNKSPDYNFVYDQVVCYGELLSTTIVHAYLEHIDLRVNWLDIRECLKTDATYREGKVNWDATQLNLLSRIDKNAITLTQGFIGSDLNGFSTTLGREGSDYSAAILAYCLGGESVTIWKDVPGVLSADPRYFNNAVLLNTISYQEAIELAFYGASVIHPKTLQPLQRKEIPLYVKPFGDPRAQGTCVTTAALIDPKVPCFILKTGQVLLSLSSLDFSFMAEENIGEIFKLLGKYRMKADMIQNSAISFSLCVDNKYGNLDLLVNKLKADFKVRVYEGVSLYTIRHFSEETLTRLEKDKEVLLKQVTKNTVQLVVL